MSIKLYSLTKRQELITIQPSPSLKASRQQASPRCWRIIISMSLMYLQTVQIIYNPSTLVNKSAKEFMRVKFREWYAGEVQKQLDSHTNTTGSVDLKLSTMKPLGNSLAC